MSADERTFGVTFGENLANFGETPNVSPLVRRKIDVWGDIWGIFVCSDATIVERGGFCRLKSTKISRLNIL